VIESAKTPRQAVVETYARWLKHKFRVDNEVGALLQKWNWQSRDKALLQELLYGVVRRHGTLDYLIRRLSDREVKVDPYVFAATAVTLYQLLYLDRIPDHAAVNTSVELAKEHSGEKSAGWVNALLRRAIRERTRLFDFKSQSLEPLDRLSFEYSHPRWMLSRWMEHLTAEKLERFLPWNNRRPSLCLRINRRMTDSQTVADELRNAGVDSEQHHLDRFYLLIRNSGDPADLEIVKDGRATPQDISQGLVGRLVDPQPGEVILDLCAAPGGKTGHLAEICPDCKIIATDKSYERLQLLRDNISRSRLNNVEILSYDEVVSSGQKFDVILVDAPCTGTGVLARRPDLRWRRIPGDIEQMAKIQHALLEFTAERLNAQGRIIYSTCSIEPEENDEMVHRFLTDNTRIEIKTANQYLAQEVVDEEGFLRVLGPEIKGDGVFAARLEKIAR